MTDSKEVTNWEEKLAAMAQQEASVARPTSSTISFRTGIISYEGQAVPDNKLPCLVLDVIAERTYYESKWDPDNPSPPTCFALGRLGDDLVPHDAVKEPQHDNCEDCPMNAWGSAGDGRRGKACQERKRMALIPATAVDSDESVRSAEVATAKLPVTSGRNWDNYAIKVAKSLHRPTFAVLTEITAKPDPKRQFVVDFNLLEEVPLTLLNAIEEKRNMAEPIIWKPYDMSGEAEQAAPQAKGSKHKA